MRPGGIKLTPPTAAMLLSGLLLSAPGAAQPPADLHPGPPALDAVNYPDEVVIYVSDLDLLRAGADGLTAEIALRHDGGEDRHAVDLSAPSQPPAIVMRKRPGRRYRDAQVRILAGGEELLSGRIELQAPTEPHTRVPLSGRHSAIEPGQAPSGPTEIDLPDVASLRELPLETAQRRLRVEDITAQIRSEINYPLISAHNNCAISLQTRHPDEPQRRSLYVPTKSQLFNPDTGEPSSVAHYLVEVPVNERWLAGDGDETVNLPPDAIEVHTSEMTWPPDPASGQPILGSGSGGLGQLVGTVDVDDQGRIYYAHVPSGVVRFDPRTSRFETPPIDVDEHIARFLPSLDDLPDEHKQGELSLRWEGYKIIAIRSGRLFYAPIITAVYQGQDRTSFVFAGLLSMPVEGWDDAAAFTDGICFHAGSWPGCERVLFEGWTDPADRTRKLGRLWPREDGLYITAYRREWGGPWKLEVDDEGRTVWFGRVESVPRADPQGLPTEASGLADWWSYGTIRVSRSNLDRILHRDTGEQLQGEIAVNYDPVARMRQQPERYATLLEAMSGPSLAPAYMAVAIPGEPNTVLGVAEYGYYLATFDLSSADDGVVTKRYLKRDVGTEALELPLAVGLGPYGHVSWRSGDSRFLYIGGYTGLTRLVHGAPDLPPDRCRMENLSRGLETRRLDEAGEGGIKRYRYLRHGLDGRIFLTGTHTAQRGGTAYSGGLMSFRPENPTTLEKLSFMSRCYWTMNLRSRIVHRPDGAPAQELFLGGSGLDEGYAFTLEPALVPENRDPKLFVYECASAEAPRSILGLSLPPVEAGGPYHDHALDRTRRYLVILQGANLLCFDVRARRFIDGARLSGDAPVEVAEFRRPDHRLVRSPDDQLWLYAAT
ncbi:MAG: hypothetical protein U9R79_14670, partial [Armatimonadota bacterium]|nr:hypothetical protein [Armatimonadota bacterium]